MALLPTLEHAQSRKGLMFNTAIIDNPHATAPMGSERSPKDSPSKWAARQRRRRAGWDVASVVACTLLLVLGALLISICTRMLTGATAAHGQLLGALCCVLSVLGWVSAGLPIPCSPAMEDLLRPMGLPKPTSWIQGVQNMLGLPLRTALLVGLALSVLGTLSLMEQAASEKGTTCLLAEASIRINHLESTITKLRQDELMTQLFFRLNEMDDLLAATAQGGAAHAEVHSQLFHLQTKDREVIRERVERLQRHAASLRQDMQHQLTVAKAKHDEAERNITVLQQAAERPGSLREYEELRQQLVQHEEDKKQRAEALWLLEKRADAVQSVIHYLESRSHDGHAELSFDEYEIILKALLDGSAPLGSNTQEQQQGEQAAHQQTDQAISPNVAIMRQALSRDQADAETAKAAFQRRASGSTAYEQAAQSDPRLHVTQQLAQKREAARKEFEARFFGVFEEGAGHLHPDNFAKSLVSALDGLPQHCIADEKAFRWLRWLCFGLVFTQALAVHTVVTGLVGKVLTGKEQ